jgi:RNA polymerase sigma factor (sigma-70 family)
VNSVTDPQLLRDYAERRSEAAFAELMRRHVDFVYSAALRMVRDAHLAEDVTQSAFIALAQNARQLADRPVLSGWLHRTVQNLAANTVRSDVRRRAREQEAAVMNKSLAAESDANWENIAAHLDAGLGELDEADRDALLLRYFERKSAREMAEVLGTTEDAAQKRVSRAVERLREFFSKRNVTIGAGGLAVLISANAVQSAPIGLGAAILTVITGTTKTIGITMIQKILITGITAAAVGTGIYAFHLQREVGSLGQQQALLGQQIEQLSRERDDAKNQLAALQQENKQLRANEPELLKLRGEVTQSRRQQNLLPAAAQSETNNLLRAERTSIRVGTKFILFPTEALQSLGVKWMSGAQDSRAGLLTEQQFKIINEALQGASDVKVISAPTVISLNGERAQMSVSRSVPAGGTNVNVGVSLAVLPYFSTNSSTFDLTLSAELKQLVGDSLQPDVQTTQITNQMSLLPGQTAVLEKEIPGGGWLSDATNIPAGPRVLLMFVTPTIVDSRDYQRNGLRVAGIWKSPTNMDSPDFPKSQ